MQEAGTKYHDTQEGVAAMLRANSQFALEGARFVPDGWIKGVWNFTLRDGTQGVAYLAGYTDPFGETRSWNDFEIRVQPTPRQVGAWGESA